VSVERTKKKKKKKNKTKTKTMVEGGQEGKRMDERSRGEEGGRMLISRRQPRKIPEASAKMWEEEGGKAQNASRSTVEGAQLSCYREKMARAPTHRSIDRATSTNKKGVGG